MREQRRACGMKRCAKLSISARGCGRRMRFSCACAATSVDLLWRSRSALEAAHLRLRRRGPAEARDSRAAAAPTGPRNDQDRQHRHIRLPVRPAPSAATRPPRVTPSPAPCVSSHLRSNLPSSEALAGVRAVAGAPPRARPSPIDQRDELAERLAGLGPGRRPWRRAGRAWPPGRDLLVERDDEIDLAFDRGLEILAADLLHRRPARGWRRRSPCACGALALSQDRMRIVSRAAASVISTTTTARGCPGPDAGCWTSIAARQIDHRALERVADLLLQLVESRAVGQQRRLIGASADRTQSLLVGADHRALDEQAVDAARILDRVGQAAAGLEVERQRAGAEMHVEVEQRGRAAALSPNSQASEVATVEAPTPPRVADHRRHDVRPVDRRFGEPRAAKWSAAHWRRRRAAARP